MPHGEGFSFFSFTQTCSGIFPLNRDAKWGLKDEVSTPDSIGFLARCSTVLVIDAMTYNKQQMNKHVQI